jgi:DNA-binding response OmpR family regulator
MPELPATAPLAPPPAEGEGLRVICADDDRLLLTLYQKILSRKSYQVRTCETGSAVLPLLDQAPADLVILDLAMPGMSGLEVLAELRKHPLWHDLPVLIVSAISAEDTVAKGISLGADDYLVKPVRPGELLAKAGMALRKRRLASLTSTGLSLGSLLAYRYRIVSTLGAGGYGTVYLAQDVETQDQPRVAVKIFHADQSAKDGFMSRYLREAYAHMRLQHPNIVRLLDFGHYGPVYYLVMEHLDGLNLADIIAQQGPLDVETAALIAYELSKALAYLGENGVVHRDVKPRNIMITHAGETKLLDFGLVRPVQDQTVSLSDRLRGTPHYVSPEYITANENLDIRADVYSLGVTLYHAVSKAFPFPEASDWEIIAHHLAQPRIPLGSRCPQLPPEFTALVDRMVQHDRERRPLPGELSQVLLRLLGEESAAAS